MQSTIEAMAQGISWDDIFLAREKTWDSVRKIAAMIQPGMTEKEAISEANRYFASQGVKKFWHKTHIRMGKVQFLVLMTLTFRKLHLCRKTTFSIST